MRNPSSTTISRLWLSALLAALLLVSQSLVSWAAAPTIALNQSTGKWADEIVVTGTGWTPGEQVTLYNNWGPGDGEPYSDVYKLASSTASSTGQVTFCLTPSAETFEWQNSLSLVGAQTSVTCIYCDDHGTRPYARYDILLPQMTSTNGITSSSNDSLLNSRPGQRIDFTGVNYFPGEKIHWEVSNMSGGVATVRVGSGSADAAGTVKFSWTPDGSYAGSTWIMRAAPVVETYSALGATGGVVLNSPKVTATASGRVITVNGTGFPQSQRVSVLVATSSYSATTDASGNFRLRTSDLPAGTYIVSAPNYSRSKVSVRIYAPTLTGLSAAKDGTVTASFSGLPGLASTPVLFDDTPVAATSSTTGTLQVQRVMGAGTHTVALKDWPTVGGQVRVYRPTLEVSANKHGQVSIVATGLPANSPQLFVIAGERVQVTADATGVARTSRTMPAGVVQVQLEGWNASASTTVYRPSLEATSDGTTLQITGSGWPAGERLTIYVAGTPVTVTASDTGTISLSRPHVTGQITVEGWPTKVAIMLRDLKVTAGPTSSSTMIGREMRVTGSVDAPGSTIAVQVKDGNVFTTVATGKADATGKFNILVNHGFNRVGESTWRVRASLNNQVGESAPFTHQRTPWSVGTAGTKVIGLETNTWGGFPELAGTQVATQVNIPGRGWTTSQTRIASSTGGFVIPLTYGGATKGTMQWRVVAKMPQGWVTSQPFTLTRTGWKPGYATTKRIGELGYTWGAINGSPNRPIQTQVLLSQGWVTSQTGTTKANSSFQLPLTYGRWSAGVITFRVVAQSQYGWIVSEPMPVTRR